MHFFYNNKKIKYCSLPIDRPVDLNLGIPLAKRPPKPIPLGIGADDGVVPLPPIGFALAADEVDTFPSNWQMIVDG